METATYQWITLILQILAPIVTVGILLYQNRILNTQVKTQKDLIQNLESYNKIIDLKKVNEFVELREKVYDDKFVLEKSRMEEANKQLLKASEETKSKAKTQEETIKQIDAARQEIGGKFLEVSNAYLNLMSTYVTPASWENHIDHNFPTSKELMKEFLKANKPTLQERRESIYNIKSTHQGTMLDYQNVSKYIKRMNLPED